LFLPKLHFKFSDRTIESDCRPDLYRRKDKTSPRPYLPKPRAPRHQRLTRRSDVLGVKDNLRTLETFPAYQKMSFQKEERLNRDILSPSLETRFIIHKLALAIMNS
jgi:hypothetical protein